MILRRFTARLKSGPGFGVRFQAKSALGQKQPLSSLAAQRLLSARSSHWECSIFVKIEYLFYFVAHLRVAIDVALAIGFIP